MSKLLHMLKISIGKLDIILHNNIPSITKIITILTLTGALLYAGYYIGSRYTITPPRIDLKPEYMPLDTQVEDISSLVDRENVFALVGE